ncbi:hypothetical protein OBV_18070 [Oscillibacter valericigenes Sjm18-20]|nr:hypothetical protein OBV_18070 [Oscillibacter valericigenes Sjm18-20]
MIGIVSKDPVDYMKVAYAIEILAYHNKNYLCDELAQSDCKANKEIQFLLSEGIRKSFPTA